MEPGWMHLEFLTIGFATPRVIMTTLKGFRTQSYTMLQTSHRDEAG